MRLSILLLSLIGIISSLFANSQPSSVDYKLRLFGGKSEWTQSKRGSTNLVSKLRGFRPSPMTLSQYGGVVAGQFSATGFFYTKQINDRWCFIDPEGNPYIMIGLVALAPYDKRFEEVDLGSYQTEDAWAKATTDKFRDLGFNCSGPWSFDEALQAQPQPLNYTKALYLMYTFAKKYYGGQTGLHNMDFANGVIPVLDPRFETYAAERLRKVIESEWIDDPHLIGYFVDNELPWEEDSLQRFLELDEEDINYQKAIEWIATETSISLSRAAKLKTRGISEALSKKFLSHITDKYYSTVRKALKAVDPNHLYLGSRVHRPYTNSEALFTSMGKYVDVVSVNYYHTWAPDPEQMTNWVDWSDKPLIISEWYAKGEDSDCENISGAGLLVESQADRGHFYQTFTLGLLENKNCIGWHWYKYKDSPTKGKDSNRGFLSKSFEDYMPLQKAASEVNNQVYNLVRFFDTNQR
ncbi:MAG: hypothetical protein ACSHYA_11715 [Opitutaceae bacterium]